MQSKRSRKDACSHNVYIKGLCGNCGVRLDPPQSTSVSMVHSVPELKVSEEYAKEIGKADQERLIRERKLVLLVDLDQTVLHTTHEVVKDDSNVHSFQLWPGHPTYFTKLRPHLREFLEQMSNIYELHIFTFGCRMYAHKIASIIDPDQKFFGNRILSRDESVDQYSKRGNLNNLFPCGDAMVCIIDDRSDVWHDAGNLIQVKPYSYFKTSISDGAFARASNRGHSSKEEEDESLDTDLDKLKALLGVDDNLSSASSSSKSSDSECESSSSSSSKDDKEKEGTSDVKEAEPNQGDELKVDQEAASHAGESSVGEDLSTRRAEKRLKVDDETGHLDALREKTKTFEPSLEELVRAAHHDLSQKVKSAGLEQKGPENTEPSSSGDNEDTDDHLLKMQTILGRIHEKWYMELDEQRQFLEEGENYKLPDIKDVISKYLRKSYR